MYSCNRLCFLIKNAVKSYILCIFVEMLKCHTAIAPLLPASRRLLSFLPPSSSADPMLLAVLENLVQTASKLDNVVTVNCDATRTDRKFARFPPAERVI